MYNDTITEHDLLETVRAVSKEILEYNPDAREVEDLEDAIREQADSLVNVYYYACAQEWLAVGMPLTYDLVGETFEGDAHQQIAFGMYYWYDNQLTETLMEMLDERNKARQ